jgi:hypothetical protein
VSHIPDTGKMVSDTPRTDAAWKPDGGDGYPTVDVDLARQLERELNASTSEIARLTSKVAQLYEGAEEQNQRIKRLEEALGCVVVGCNYLHHRKKHQHRSGEPCPVEELIRKAKEDKP